MFLRVIPIENSRIPPLVSANLIDNTTNIAQREVCRRGVGLPSVESPQATRSIACTGCKKDVLRIRLKVSTSYVQSCLGSGWRSYEGEDRALTDDYTLRPRRDRCSSYNRRIENQPFGETRVRKARTIIATTACLLACASVSVYAHGGGNGGGGGGGGNGGGNGGAAGASPGHSSLGHADGMSLGHMSKAGFSNTNSHVSADRDKGHERAADRAALHAQAHHAHADGRPATHMSRAGSSNTNSHVSADRDKGLARASDRAALQAQPHLGAPS